MWHSGCDEEWKRRKEYLIRSLFDEVPLLSAVAEAEESFICSDVSPSGGDVFKPSDVLPSTVESRPYSPLPPLIIEKEPNRHDEPNEYYRQLELKMLRLYRRLFIEDRSASSSLLESDNVSKSVNIDDQNSDMEIETATLQHVYLKSNYLAHESNMNEGIDVQGHEDNAGSSLNPNISYQRHDSDFDINIMHRLSDSISEGVENTNNHIEPIKKDKMNTARVLDDCFEDIEEEQESLSPLIIHEYEQLNVCNSDLTRKINSSDTNEQEDNNITTIQNRIIEKYGPSSSTESSTEYFQQITFEAQVHRPDNREDVEQLSDIYEETERQSSGRILRENSLESRDENQVSELDKEKAIERSASEESEAIEIMRTPRLTPLAESLQNDFNKTDTSISHISMERCRARSRSLETYSHSEILRNKSNLMDIERCSDDFSQILQCSTPKRNKKRRQNGSNARNNEINHVNLTSSHKKKKCEDASAQVSHKSSWSSLRHNFFIGSPKILRICSCNNHFCQS